MIPTLNGADWPCLLLTTVLHQTRLAPPAGFSPIAFSVSNPGIPAQRLGVTRSRPLGKNGIAHLCEQDVSALTANLLALEPGAKSVVVLPTHDLAKLASCSGRVHQRESERHICRDQRINKVTMKEFGSIGFTTSGSSTSPYSGSSCPSLVLVSSSRLS